MIQQISPNLWFVQRGWLNANHLIFNGQKRILIDTGYITHFEETRKLIESVGVDLRTIDLIVSTHSHCDHIGGNKKIQDLSGCDIAIHRIDKQAIDSRDDWATWYRFYDQEAEFFTVTQALEEGEKIYLDDLELQILHTPGHARGGICLYCPEQRFLISADALWDGDVGVLNTIVEGPQAPLLAMQSLEKIAALDIATVYPGHGGVIHNPHKAIDKCKRKLAGLMNSPASLGNDHLKKILIWTLLMKNGYARADLFPYLMKGYWFRAGVDAYFGGQYQQKFNELMDEFLGRGIVYVENGCYHTVVAP